MLRDFAHPGDGRWSNYPRALPKVCHLLLGMGHRRVRAALLLALASLIGCSSSDQQADSPPPTPPEIQAATPGPDLEVKVSLAPDTIVECGGSTTFPARALDQTVPLEEADVAPAALGPIEEFLATGEGDFWPQEGYRVLHQTDTSLLLVRVGEGGNTVLLGSELAGGGWRATELRSGAPCPIRVPLPPELHEVNWRLDPNLALDEGATQLTLLATGQACSGGRAMGDRLQPPTVLLTDTTIFISLAAEQPGGAQTCPGNPEELLIIDLGEPLGDREVVDGRTTAGLISDYVPAS